MTLRSYNGWPASPNTRLRPLVVAGEAFVPGVLDNDDVYTIFKYVAEQMHKRVEPIVRDDWHQMDDWGFSFRLTTNDNSLSCHASATAIDYNATRHPFGVPIARTMTPAQISEVHQILAEVGCVEWGGDWNLADGMHFEIDGSPAEVAAAADRIRNNQGEPPMAQADDILEQLRKLSQQVERTAGQNSRIIRKLNKQAQRYNSLAKSLEDVAKDVAPGSKSHKKLNTLIAELREHDADFDEEPTEAP